MTAISAPESPIDVPRNYYPDDDPGKHALEPLAQPCPSALR